MRLQQWLQRLGKNIDCIYTTVFYVYVIWHNFWSIIPRKDDGFGHCDNIDECMATPCGTNANCHDTLGSYICDCQAGYEADSYKDCVDIDECTIDGKCPHVCTNKAGMTLS